MRNTSDIWSFVEGKERNYFELSDRIWGMPELNYQEFRSAEAHAERLAQEGFKLTKGIAGLPTAVMGEAGEGGPVIAILGEYDALPGLSQEAGIAEKRADPQGTNGHACGHNMLGSASLLAAVALKDWLSENKIQGRVRYYGCPAEEGGSGKGYMVRDGVFDDVDIAICWHPSAFTGVNRPYSLACVEVDFHFTGRSSHAAAAPHLGRSALDAVELMNIGVNYMREHMPQTARIHYALIDGGGVAPNVVQGQACVRYLIRAETLPEMWVLVERVKKIAEGAALMSETKMEHRQLSGDANLVGNDALERAMFANMQRLGPPRFDEEDKAYARKIQETLRKEDIVTSYGRFGLAPRTNEALNEEIYPFGSGVNALVGSTDVGTVSWVVPTVQCRVACYAVGTPGHSWQLVAQGLSPAAHKGLSYAAKIMAGTAADVFKDAALLGAAKSEHRAFRAENAFVNPIADDLAPPLDMAAH